MKRRNQRARSLEKRARQVLRPSGDTREALREAYRCLAKRHHPDADRGNSRHFQVVREAYALLAFGEISNPSLLADDELIIELTKRRVEPLEGDEGMKSYARKVREQFFWDW